MFLTIMGDDALELPPCFTVWCEGCGWRGREARAAFYIVGECEPIEENSISDMKCWCLKCGRRTNRCCDPMSMVARFHWVCDHARCWGAKEMFPCTCATLTPCRFDDKPDVRRSTQVDSCGVCDDEWLRVAVYVQCCGCYAKGKIVMLEKHTLQDADAAGWYGRRD